MSQRYQKYEKIAVLNETSSSSVSIDSRTSREKGEAPCPFLHRLFHDPPVIFQRAATTGNSPDGGDGGPTSTDKRFTNTSTAGDISLLNYAG
ncbi:hypothetical protein ANTRET_LOCUS5102 [Anthophora retusa]